MTVVWLLVVWLTYGSAPDTLYFEQYETCKAAREEVIYKLSSTDQDSFAFSGPPYGGVSKCTKIEVERVPRRT